MKKIIKSLFYSFIIFLIIVIAVISILFIALYDSKDVTNYENICKDTPSNLVFNNALYDGTYDVKKTKEGNILFSENELELFLYPIVMSLNLDELPFEIVGVDIDVKNGKYYFETSVTLFNFFKSVLEAELLIENKNEMFSITLKNLKLGALSATKISSFITKHIDPNQLNNELIKKNIYVNIDLKNFIISCSYEDIKRMLKNNINNEQGDLYSLLFDVFLANKQFMDLSLGDDNLLGAYIHMGAAEYKENIEEKLNYTYSFDSISNMVSELLEKELITYKDVNLVFNYLVRGYDALDDDEKILINDISLGDLVIDKKNYKGIIEKPNLSLVDYITEIFNGKTAFQLYELLKNGITLSDDFLTSLLQNFNYMGYSYAYSNEDNKVGYFVLEQLNLVCNDQFIDIKLIMNFNGLLIFLEASFDCFDENSKGLKIKGSIHDVNIGEYLLNDNQKELLIAYLSALLDSLEWISIDENDQGIVLDFSNALVSIFSNNLILNNLIGNSINEVTNTYIEEGEVAIKFDIQYNFY